MIIYRSFVDSIGTLPPEDQATLWAAIFAYGLDFKPPTLTGILNAIFMLIKPQLDANIRKFENGARPKQGGSKPKQTGSKAGTNDNVNSNANEKGQFEAFRILYQGTKRGLDTEFGHFTEQHPNWREILPLLKPSIEKQIQHRASLEAGGKFVPTWKNLKTWLNQKGWEEETIIPESTKRPKALAI